MKTENSTDKLFRDNLRNHGITPSASAWETLEKSLDQNAKPKGFPYKKAVFALAVMLMVSGGIWYASNSENSDKIANISTHDSLKNTKNQTHENTAQYSVLEEEKMPKITQIQDENEAQNLPEKEIEKNQNSEVTITYLTDSKSNQSKKLIDSKNTVNQDINSNNADTISVKKEVTTVVSEISTEEKISEKEVSPKPQKIEIIIKMGSEAGNRQSPRNSEISEMFPEADSIEKVQKNKSSRFGRVMKQAKNFKNGEKVDLTQLKKNPNSN